MKEIKSLAVSSAYITPPPSKAHTLRALILASLCDGTSTIKNALLADDQQHLIGCLRNLGVDISIAISTDATPVDVAAIGQTTDTETKSQKNGQQRLTNTITVVGKGVPFQVRKPNLDCGESGVAVNYLTALVCFADSPVTISGKESVLKRPIGDLTTALKALGVAVTFLGEEGYPPVRIEPGTFTKNTVALSGKKSSQYFSALSIAGALHSDGLEIVCTDELSEKPYLDITLEMMRLFCVLGVHEDYAKIKVFPNQEYRPQNLIIEGDYSSASYFFLASAITGIKITMPHLNMQSVQGDKKIVDFMRAMGCKIWEEDDAIVVQGPQLEGEQHGTLKPLDIDCSDTPDIVPTLAVALAFADGKSVLRNISQLRYKECDRVVAVCDGLERMGIRTEVSDNDNGKKDGKENLIVYGSPNDIHGAVIDSYNDHRIAMSFAVPGLILRGQKITNPACVAKSFPNFWNVFDTLSSSLRER